MIGGNENFGGTRPFAPRYFSGNGFRMHYVDEGQGDPIVCLHGEPTWGCLYRCFIPPLSQTHRVIVSDHMGFGKSETPRDRHYSLKPHVENLTERIKRLFFLNTLSGYGKIPFVMTTQWFSFIKKHHDANTLHEVLGNLDANVLRIMKIIGFENSAAVDRNWIAAYSVPFPTKEDCVGAIEFRSMRFWGGLHPISRKTSRY